MERMGRRLVSVEGVTGYTDVMVMKGLFDCLLQLGRCTVADVMLGVVRVGGMPVSVG